MNVTSMYWEIYDDQSAEEFSYIGYTDLEGKDVVVPISSNLARQVAEIRRTNGDDVEVKVYRDQMMVSA